MQTVVAVTLLLEQEFTGAGVTNTVDAPPGGSTGTALMLSGLSAYQKPCGTKAVTLVPWMSTDSDEAGRHESATSFGVHVPATQVSVATHIAAAFGKLHIAQVHCPAMHTSPCAHTLPHAPQLLESLPGSTHVDGADPPKQQLDALAAQTASLWFATCAGTPDAPMVMSCTFPGLPGGKWQIVTLSFPGPAAATLPGERDASVKTKSAGMITRAQVFIATPYR